MKNVCAFGLSLACVAGLAGSVQAFEGSIDPSGAVDAGNDLIFQEQASLRELNINVDSGIVRVAPEDIEEGARSLHIPVWSEVVEVSDAEWVRLRFRDVQLARSTQDVRESYIKVTSLQDGHEQYLDIDSMREWNNSSAYFNGGSVRVELMASPNVTNQINRVRVVGVQASAPVVGPRSICGPVDDRELSYDNRDARLMPIGCTAWLFSDHGSRMLTAAHCGPAAGDVIQFNVPLSSSGGGTRNPPPQDQYPIDGSSVQESIGGVFIGNDWAYFGVFDNSNTGMSPVQSYGLFHTLADSQIPSDGRPIRITGYGSTSSPVPASWYLVQKTHVGPLASISGNTVRYATDTSGGNSGGVVLDENNQIAIAIHTNAGCNSGGGSNQATSLFNNDLQNALANPLGICQPRNIQASLLFEPTHIDPSGGEVLTLVIDNLQGHTLVDNPMMFVDSGSGFVGTPMMTSGANSFDGAFPAIDCGSEVSYYISYEDEEGTVSTVPENGSLSTVALDELTVVMEDDFEVNMDWVTFTTGGSGAFLRTIPANHGLGDPPSDADGSDKCFVTSNNNGVDVDNGSVHLMTPLIDLTGIDSPVLRMSLWMFGSAGDEMKIEFTDSAGATWVEVDSLTNTAGWEPVEYNIADYVTQNLAFRMRITVTDGGADTTVEGGVDGFKISREVCENTCPADINGDGALNFFDVSAYLSAFGEQDPIADFTGDGSFNFFDVSAYLSAFGEGCP